MKYVVIFLIIIGFFVISSYNAVDGLWIPQSTEELFEQSQTIFVGNITSVKVLEFEKSSSYTISQDGVDQVIVENYTLALDEYTVDIEEFVKNPQEFSIITVRQPTIGLPVGLGSHVSFELGDRVLFYVKNLDGENTYSPESFVIPKICDAKQLAAAPRSLSSVSERHQEGNTNTDEWITGKNIHFKHFTKGELGTSPFDYNIAIYKFVEQDRNTTEEIVWEKQFRVEKDPCTWNEIIEWDFLPTEPGKYKMVTTQTKPDEGRSTSGSSTFFIKEDKSTVLPLKLDDFASKLWYEHDYIVDGTILDIRGYDKSERIYDIQINSFFKPSEGAGIKIITVYGSPNFYNIKGDRGIFFIKKEDARWTFGEYGAKATENCPPYLMYHSPPLIDPPLVRGQPPMDFSLLIDCYPYYYKKYLPQYLKARGATEFPSPRSQAVDGVPPHEIVCNEDLQVVIRHNGDPACVKPETKQKLIERGWAKDDTWTATYDRPESNSTPISELPQHAMNPDTFLRVIDVAYKSWMELELTSFEEYEKWQERRGPEAKHVPILNIREDNIHPLVLQIINSMWDLEGYQPSKYDENLHVKKIDLNSTEIDHKSIYDWLDATHVEQFGETEDASFSNHFTFRQNLYKLSWGVSD